MMEIMTWIVILIRLIRLIFKMIEFKVLSKRVRLIRIRLSKELNRKIKCKKRKRVSLKI